MSTPSEPFEDRQGRFISAAPDDLNAWFGRQAGKPVHVATPQTDLSAELKRGLAFARKERKPAPQARPGMDFFHASR